MYTLDAPRTCRYAHNTARHHLLAHGLPYSRTLRAHTSCVNALKFSSGNGKFLASAGDDHRIHLWNFHQQDVSTPSHTFSGPTGNIFSLAFSAQNGILYAGGLDETVYSYDLSNLQLANKDSHRNPSARFTYHAAGIYSVSAHPVQETVVLTSSEDGRVVMLDTRADNRPTSMARSTLQLTSEVTDAQFHPHNEHWFVTSLNDGHLALRDRRMAFGSLKDRSNHGIVLDYCTNVCRPEFPESYAKPEISSLAFNTDGTMLVATMMSFHPVIYSLSDPFPLAICTGDKLPDGTLVPQGQRTYSNCCTMKHGSFGNLGLDNAEFYCAGSDDFRAYMWSIPQPAELGERRETADAASWAQSSDIAFADTRHGARTVPAKLDTPFCRLGGHKSIVNSTAIHPELLHIVTAGIERNIILHSPTPNSPCTASLEETPLEVRELPPPRVDDAIEYLRALTGPHLTLDTDMVSEARTLRMFDHILRTEGDTTLFPHRQSDGWDDNSPSPSEDE